MKDIHPLLNKECQRKARKYEKEKRLLGLAGMFLSLVILLVFYFSGVSTKLANLDTGHPLLWTVLIYGGVFYAAMTIFRLPLAFYSGFVHEHRWKFSNHTVMSWWWEQIKSFFVGLAIFLIVFGLLLWIMAITPGWWWLVAALAMALAGAVFATLFPVVIAPIFNEYKPIEDEELTGALDRLLARGGLRSSGFFEEDMSRQTKKENAFLAGLGKTRRVVLADNMLKNMTVPEIESIIAHEVGHYKYRHIWKIIGIGTVQQLLTFYLLGSLMKWIFPQFLSSTQWNLSLFPVFALLMGGVSGFLFAPLNNALSRSFERKADRYALENSRDSLSFMKAMAGLADRNLSNAYPAWWMKLLYYSHPPIGERLKMAGEHSPTARNDEESATLKG